jgi:chaperonin GroEL
MNNQQQQPQPQLPETYMLFGQDARDALVEGVTLVYKAVCSTLSPKGRNVGIARQFGAPIVVHDGVTVAKEVKSPNAFVQMGIDLVREASQKTNDEAGDGTTTSALIAYELVIRGLELVKHGMNPMILRTQLYEALEQIKPFLLDKLSKPAKTQRDLERVASISSSDELVGKMVGEAVFKVGADGLVAVEESGGYDTYISYTEGMTIDKGWISPYLVTNTQRMEAVVSKPVIAITDKSITTGRELVPLVEAMMKVSKNIVIIGEVKGDALGILVQNKMKGVINALVVEAPGYGDNRREYLEDLAVLTGATVFSQELGMDTEQFANSFDINWLGKCDKMIATKKTTMVIKGSGDKKKIAAQVKKIKSQLVKSESKAERERLEERLAKMTTGVAVVKVGAKTDIEAREKLERVKDAVGSATSALQEGIVPGSGVTFMHLADAIVSDTPGARLMKEVLVCPLRKVMLNSGESDKRRLFGLVDSDIDTLVREIRMYSSDEMRSVGYNSLEMKIDNMERVGIIDPTKVIRLCIENGLGVAASILTTDTLVDIEQYRKQVA